MNLKQPYKPWRESCPDEANGLVGKRKKGNRWKSNKGQLRYKIWRKNVYELNKRKVGLSKNYVCIKCNKKR